MKKTITLSLVLLGGIANLNAQSWQPLSAGVDGWVTTLCEFEDGYLLAGGNFSNANGNSSPGFAEWSNSSWWTFNPGADYPIHALYKDPSDGNIYFGGEFMNIGGVAANRIAAYDGLNWTSMGIGLPASVNSILRYNGELYAGTLSGLYKWTGTVWQELNFSDANYVIITDMEIYQNELYVAGSFDMAGGNTVNGIAHFNGTSWSGIGTGFGQDGLADVLEVHGNELVIGGLFSTFNGVNCGGLATWNGTTAAALGTGVPQVSIGWPNRVSALESIGNTLYVGGYFDIIDGTNANNVARYDGVNFSAMSDGVDNAVYAMLEFDGDLIIGGSFVNSGSTVVNHIAKWEGVAELNTEELKISIFPNPVTDKMTIQTASEIKELLILDVQGREVARMENPANGNIVVSTDKWNSGVYLVHMRSEAGESVERVLKH